MASAEQTVGGSSASNEGGAGDLGRNDLGEFHLVATTPTPGRSAPLALALTSERAVAIVEVELGVLAGIDVVTGERLSASFRAERPAPPANVKAQRVDASSRDVAGSRVRPEAIAVTSGSAGPVVVSSWSDHRAVLVASVRRAGR